MAEEIPSLHIDTDWKKQAQEEKKRLAEQAAAKPPPITAPAGIGAAAVATPFAPAAAPESAGGSAARPGQPKPGSFAALVTTLLTQLYFYLGDLSPRGAEPMVNLDMAKQNVDLLGMLENKTANNLDEEERKLLDNALYESRMRFVSVASQYLE